MKMLHHPLQQRPFPRQLQRNLVKRQAGRFRQIEQQQIRHHLHRHSGIGTISLLKSHTMHYTPKSTATISFRSRR